MGNIQIDVSSLLTISGIVVAAYAIIPKPKLLDIKFSLSRFDTIFLFLLFLLANYLTFADTLKKYGMYFGPDLGNYAMTPGGATYILFLSSAFYFYIKQKNPKLRRNKAPEFRDAFMAHVVTQQYDEAISMAKNYFDHLVEINNNPAKTEKLISKTRNIIAGYIRIKRYERLLTSAKNKINNKITKEEHQQEDMEERVLTKIDDNLSRIADKINNKDTSRQATGDVLRALANHDSLIKHMSILYPLFCLNIMKQDFGVRSDLNEKFIAHLLDTPGSTLYTELSNNKNLSKTGLKRLDIPPENEILNDLFSDLDRTVRIYAMDKAIGDHVTALIKSDRELIDRLNGSYDIYDRKLKERCPVNAGIRLFKIMVDEAIHKQHRDHMWMYYFKYFTAEILVSMKTPGSGSTESTVKIETPSHYLIHEMLSTSMDWSMEFAFAKESEDKEKPEEDNAYFVSRHAMQLSMLLLQKIIASDKLKKQFKGSCVDFVFRRLKWVKQQSELKLYSEREKERLRIAYKDLIHHLVFGDKKLGETNHDYIKDLDRHASQCDPTYRLDYTKELFEQLEIRKQELSNTQQTP